MLTNAIKKLVIQEIVLADHYTMHLFNTGSESDLIAYLDGGHMDRAKELRGFQQAQLFRCSEHQLLPETRQAWKYAMVYERSIDTPEIDVPALAPLLADMRDKGVIAADDAERAYNYSMYHPWKYSKNYKPGQLTHLMFLLANVIPGSEEEYHKWYDDVHSVEVGEADGYVGMRRGQLTQLQIPPVHYCPGDQLILGGMQTEEADLPANLQDFIDRAYGRSPSGVAWGERSTAASLARTVHIFKSIAGPWI